MVIAEAVEANASDLLGTLWEEERGESDIAEEEEKPAGEICLFIDGEAAFFLTTAQSSSRRVQPTAVKVAGAMAAWCEANREQGTVLALLASYSRHVPS